MNIEVEIKVKAENLDKVREQIQSLGTLRKAVHQIDEYYTPVHRDFHGTVPLKEWLRIRTNPNRSVFEYSQAFYKENGDLDYANEYETQIAEPEELKKILEFLDFKKVVVVDKNREYWNCGKFEVALDEVSDLGSFVEVEAKGDFADTKEAREACIEFLSQLGIEYEGNAVKMGYPTQLLKLKKLQETDAS